MQELPFSYANTKCYELDKRRHATECEKLTAFSLASRSSCWISDADTNPRSICGSSSLRSSVETKLSCSSSRSHPHSRRSWVLHTVSGWTRKISRSYDDSVVQLQTVKKKCHIDEHLFWWKNHSLSLMCPKKCMNDRSFFHIERLLTDPIRAGGFLSNTSFYSHDFVTHCHSKQAWLLVSDISFL